MGAAVGAAEGTGRVPQVRLLRVLAATLALMLGLAACNDSTGGSDASGGTTTTRESEVGAGESGESGGGGKSGKPCPAPKAADVDPVKPVELAEGVVAVKYPHPDYVGRPWTQWGQGVALPDGRFFSAIGDHCGINGNSYLYEYDPETSQLKMVTDVLSNVEHNDGGWGYGKIHGQLVRGEDGAIYAATYWGTQKGLAYGGGYNGDLLLRLDPDTGKLTSLGVPIEKHGIPSLAGVGGSSGLIYGEAVDPLAAAAAQSSTDTTAATSGGKKKDAAPAEDKEEDEDSGGDGAGGKVKAGAFFAFDPATKEVVFRDDGPHAGFRNVMVDGKGRAYYSAGERKLKMFDPETKKLSDVEAQLPGLYLRASTRPAADGTVYGVTRAPDRLFALRPSGQIDDIGPVRGYTASLALAPDGTSVYYVPDAHGRAWESGTPIIRVDTATGKESVVTTLNKAAESTLKLRLGGSYDVVVAPDGKRLYVGFNAGPPTAAEPFGEVVLVIIDL